MIAAAFLLLFAVVKDQSENVQAQPTLSADRPDGVYLPGEVITFTCDRTNCQNSEKRAVLWKSGEDISIEPMYNSELDSAKFTIVAESTRQGNYSCSCICGDVESDKSSEVVIRVVEKPRLIPNRKDKVYVSNEKITFICTTKCPYTISSSLGKVGQRRKVKTQNYPSQSNVTFTITNTRSGRHDYYCAYQCSISGRNAVSEKSETVQITVVAQPPKPQILSDREDKIYLTNESVNLTCQVIDPVHSDCTFHLYNKQQYVKKEPLHRSSANFTVANGRDESGEYSCIYWCTVSGRNISSSESNRIKTTVVAQPPKPQILSDREDKVYLTNESVILACRITDSVHSRCTSHLYNNQQFVNKGPSQRGSAKFTVANGRNVSSEYSCIYWCMMSGRNISSSESDRIKITVVDLPRPVISLATSHVSQGEDVTFNCSFMRRVAAGISYLYKNGLPLNESVSQGLDSQNESTTFTIQNVDARNSGNYTCIYKLLEGDRCLMSAPSDAVLLSVSEKSIQLWIPALSVVALMLMFVVLCVYCWKKGKSRGHRELRAAPPPNDGGSDNVLYADLTVIARTTKQKGKKKHLETYGDDSMIYADVKL